MRLSEKTSATHEAPFGREALDRLFAPLSRARALVAAVSGGPDSIAMMHLLARWNEGPDPRSITVATVDHGLRPEAAEEAASVAEDAAILGFQHRLLTWDGPKPGTGLQERARDARYSLLVALAHEVGASHLVTAHTLDDQAETVLMRMAKGSGLTGLGGMRAERDRGGICHTRPLLDIPKADLVGLCLREGWRFVTDPSNADDRFTRARWRKLLPLLATEGLGAGRLAELARRARRADEALDRKADEALIRANPQVSAEGLAVDGAGIAAEPFEIALRMLTAALSQAGLPRDNNRLQRLEACTTRLRDAIGRGEALRATVAGAVLDLRSDGRLVIRPENARRRGR